MTDNRQTGNRAREIYGLLFALLALGLLGYGVAAILWPLAEPLAWAAILAFLLSPLTIRLKTRWPGPRSRNLIAMSLVLLSSLFVLGPLSGILAAFAAQAANLLRSLRAPENGMSETLASLTEAPLVGNLLAWLQDTAGLDPVQIDTWLGEVARSGLQYTASLGGELMLGALDAAVAFGVMVFSLFFFIRDGEGMLETFFGLIPLSEARTDRLMHHLAGVMRAVVFGVGLTAIVQGSLVGVAFAMVDLPAPIVFAALATIFALLPVGGPAIIWTPAAIALAIDGRWAAALFIVGWGMLLVATIDNLLRPLLVSHRGHVGTLTVFLGALGGAAAMGPIGLLFGPVVLALALSILSFLKELRESEKSAGERADPVGSPEFRDDA